MTPAPSLYLPEQCSDPNPLVGSMACDVSFIWEDYFLGAPKYLGTHL